MTDAVEFQIWDGEEFFAQANGPRKDAWGEAMRYASLCDEPRIEEITRRQVYPLPFQGGSEWRYWLCRTQRED